MSPSVEAVFQTARSLQKDEQIELIDALIAAMDEADPQPLSQEWMKEIQRRSAEYDAGTVSSAPWPEVRQRLGIREPEDG